MSGGGRGPSAGMTHAAATILLVEDDPATRTFLADELTADGYELLVAGSLREARHKLESRFPDLVVLDLGLPDGTGLDLLRRVRNADRVADRVDPRLPLLVLSGRTGETDRLRCFERGADDVVAKPFSYPELRARIEALLRRCEGRARTGVLRVGPLQVDPGSRVVTVHGQRVHLAAKEFSLLRALAAEPTRVFTKEELLRTVWGFRAMGTTRTLDSHACRLRSKLCAQGDQFVLNVWGVGYRLVEAPSPAGALDAPVAGPVDEVEVAA